MTAPADRIALAPSSSPEWLADAIRDGGGVVVPIEEAAALVWSDPRDPAGMAAALAANPSLRWVQLPFAGVEPFRDVLDDGRLWTCGKGIYAEPVAELALTLLLGGLRGGVRYARADHWTDQFGTSIYDGRVTILGGGGIAQRLVEMLQPFRTEVTVMRRRPEPMPGVARVVGPDQLHDVLPGADAVVLALPIVDDTVGIIAAAELALMERHAWLINVARGAHIVTDDLVAALQEESIGGAGLDVTEPEPLPAEHPLWTLPNCMITPHIGNTRVMARPLLSRRVTENVQRWLAGEELLGPVDIALGY